MIEVAGALASVALMMLVAALALWLSGSQQKELARLDGRSSTPGRSQLPAKMLFGAVGLSAVAAVLAIAGWMSA